MKLTEKDRDFLNKLKRLIDLKDLRVELQQDRPSYMVLRGTYGDKIFKSFRMTRQGVRWRFHRVFNDAYVAAFEGILMIETTFGTHLREHAIRISKERHALRQELGHLGFESADTLRCRDESEGRAPGGRE
jgi:hypothetical protein